MISQFVPGTFSPPRYSRSPRVILYMSRPVHLREQAVQPRPAQPKGYARGIVHPWFVEGPDVAAFAAAFAAAAVAAAAAAAAAAVVAAAAGLAAAAAGSAG